MKIRAVHQIEVTSRCDLACRYCPSPTLKRPKVDMSPENFASAIEHAVELYQRESQFELNLAGIGESTLHPRFALFIDHARRRMPAIRIVFATNGLNLSVLHALHPKAQPVGSTFWQEKQEHALQVVTALKGAQKTGEVHVWVSMHRPELGGLAHEVLVDALGPQSVGVSVDPSINADDWAGQVKWKRTYRQPLECQWIRDGKVMVMADGRVTTCCLDASGAGVIGHVSDDAEKWDSKPYSLCRTCQQTLPAGVEMPA